MRVSHHSHRVGSIVISIFLLPHLVSASVTLPLNGYCKPGHYFPILVDRIDAIHGIEFTAPGCIPSDFQPSWQARCVIPMLAISTPTDLKWPTGSAPLLVPKENERLIACIEATPEISQIFPGNTAIPILLNPTDLLTNPAAAWESLDAIALNADLMNRIDDSQRAVLLAAGITLASIGKAAPDTRWPWHQNGALWILNFPIVGPSQPIDQDAFLPTTNWTPGWSSTFRLQVFFAGLLLTLITLALAISKNRSARIAIPIFILCFAAAIYVWRRTLDPIDRTGGDILVKDGKLLQRDQWVYRRAKSDCVSVVPWRGLTRPIFPSFAAIDRSAMRLKIPTTGEMNFTYEATANHILGFVRREVKADELPTTQPTTQSPMRELAKEEYLSESSTNIGESQGSLERWPSVLIQRQR